MKSHLTIGIVANTTWNIYNFRLNVLKRLLQDNYHIIVFAPVDEYIEYKKDFSAVQHVPIRKLDRDSINPIKDIQLTFELNRLYKKYKPDLLIHYTVKPNIYGALAAKVHEIPSIGIVTGLGFAFLHRGFVQAITKLLYRMTFRFHQKVIFENIEDRELFISEGFIEDSMGISIKGCGVNTDHYYPISKSDHAGKTIFTFVGRLLYDKGIKEFVEAAELVKSQFKDVEFWVLGELDHGNPASVKEDDILKWVRNESIVYHGFSRDVREYIAQSDCVVLPSYREAIARSITESMSMEKPVITTDVAGCREAVDEGKNGYLVPVKDSKALADAMIRFIELDDSDKLKMGLAGRKKVLSEFDDRIIADQIVKIAESVIEAKL